MVTRKAILYLTLLVMIVLVAACQSSRKYAEQNRRLAESVGMPEAALDRLDELMQIVEVSTYELISAQRASNIEPFIDSGDLTEEIDEFWCLIIKLEDPERYWHFALYRSTSEWVDALAWGPSNYPNDRVRMLWTSAGCTNYDVR